MTALVLICATVTLCALFCVVSCMTACRRLVAEMHGMREATEKMANSMQANADRLLPLEASTRRTEASVSRMGAEVNAMHQLAVEKVAKRKRVTP